MPDEIPGNGLEEPADLDVNADAVGRDLEAVEDESNNVEETEVAQPLNEDQLIEKLTQRWQTDIVPQLTRQPEKTYTPEELDEIFQVYKPTPEILTALRSGDEAAGIEAIINMREGLQRQFAAVMQMTLDAKVAELRREFAPAANESARIASERAEKEFYGTNKDIDTKFGRKVTALVFGQFKADVAAGRRTFKSTAEAAKAVADEVRQVLKESGVPTNANNGVGNQPRPRKMAPLLKGGAPGSSGNRSTSAASGVSAQLRELA